MAYSVERLRARIDELAGQDPPVSRAEIARRGGIASPTQIYDWYAGRRTPSPKNQAKLEAGMKVVPGFLSGAGEGAAHSREICYPALGISSEVATWIELYEELRDDDLAAAITDLVTANVRLLRAAGRIKKAE